MWYIRLQELTVKGLKMTGNFLKPYGIELIDTLIYMLKSIFSLIVSILPKRQMIYSWRLKRVIPNIRRYFLVILLIYFLLAIFISRATANEKFVMPKGNITEEEREPLKRVKQEQNKVLYDTVKGYEPKKVDDQYCYVKIEIKQNGDDVIKQEILECADGKRGINTPSYWELFAQFYYRDVSAPEYCRFYSRPNHVFKSFGKTCLNKSGEWEVQ
jgi:hypothetical protein